MASPSMQWLRIPRSLTAPDAWIAIILASFLKYRQYNRRQQQNRKGKFHAGAKSKPKRNAAWSLLHECLFTHLHMFVSPFSSQASDLNAEMVDLQSEADLNSYAQKVASGKTPKKKPKDGNLKKSMEVRSRRIIKGEMVHNAYYPDLETTFILALSVVVGLVSRWLFGLIRSLTLSSAPGGFCCSPYRGGDDEGTRLAGSFERLLACVLVKQEGDNAGTLILSLLLLAFFGVVLNLAWSVSEPSAKNDNDGDEFDGDNDKEKPRESEPDRRIQRIHPRKVSRFVAGVVATLSSLMLFHTPALLRILGLDGLTEAAEEYSARLLLFANLLGMVSLPMADAPEESPERVQNLMNGLFVILAFVWGYIASGLVGPIQETARNAAHVLSPSASKKGGKRVDPKEMLDLINVRMMLLIQAMAPFIIMCTYFFSARFSETAKSHTRGDHMQPFSKHYFRNSGLFVRVALSWCFLGAAVYTLKPLLQSYLDQATTVASAMSALGEGGVNNDVNAGRGARNKRSTASSSQAPPKKTDPFSDRYKSLVLTAGRIAAFPAFILAIVSMGYLRGGDGSSHPGIGYESQPKDAPRTQLPVKGLLPPYGDRCMSWIAYQSSEEASAGDGLLHAAALSQSSWASAPFRDSAHKKVVSIFGEKLCYPPELRSIKAVGRHVNFLLDNDSTGNEGSILTLNPRNGHDLLNMAPPIPVSAVDVLLGKKPGETSSEQESCDHSKTELAGGEEDSSNSEGREECKSADHDAINFQLPSVSQMASFLVSHNFLTPSIVFPIVDTLAFLSCIWWNYWYSVMMIVYWVKLRGAASSRMTT